MQVDSTTYDLRPRKKRKVVCEVVSLRKRDKIDQEWQSLVKYEGEDEYKWVPETEVPALLVERLCRLIEAEGLNFKVDRILDRKEENGTLMYLCAWEKHPMEDNTWQPKTKLVERGYQHLIDAYHDQKRRDKGKDKELDDEYGNGEGDDQVHKHIEGGVNSSGGLSQPPEEEKEVEEEEEEEEEEVHADESQEAQEEEFMEEDLIVTGFDDEPIKDQNEEDDTEERSLLEPLGILLESPVEIIEVVSNTRVQEGEWDLNI